MKPSVVLGAIGVAISSFIGYNFIYLPSQKEVKAIHTKIAGEEASQRTQKDVVELLDQIEQSRARLPKEPDPSWLAHEVVALAQKDGVQFSTISQEPPQNFQQYTRLAVTVQLSTSYHQLGSFLDALERSDHFIRVEQLNVSRASNDGKASIRLTVSTFYLPPVLKILTGGAGG